MHRTAVSAAAPLVAPVTRRLAAFFFLAAVAASPLAQTVRSSTVDPRDILQAAKSASGGSAWDALRTQHSKVSLSTSGLAGTAERWADMTMGGSLLRYDLGSLNGTVGYDGATAWSQNGSDEPRAASEDGARELAVNASYRDRLAFWYPERGAAEIVYRGIAEADDAQFDVVRITPRGGRLFELWINHSTHLIERLLERDAQQTRTELYMDFRPVQGVQIPFRVRSTRGDPKYDELVVVDSIEYNKPLDGIAFGLPPPSQPDYTFPAGRSLVEVPFEVHNGHLFVHVMLNGKGPFRMLFDGIGDNVLMPKTAAALGLTPDHATPAPGSGDVKADVGLTLVDRVEIGGIVVARQSFATINLSAFIQRVEGFDDVAGLVGYELFKRFPVTLDYARSRAIFYDPATFKYSGAGTRMPFQFNERLPEVDGAVDGIAGKFAIDTGSHASLTLSEAFVKRNGLVAKYGAAQEITSGAALGGHVHSILARAGTLVLGPIAIDHPVTALSTQAAANVTDAGFAGNVGYGVLRQFTLTFDYANQALYIEKNANFGEADVYDRAGLWIERARTGYAVVDIVKGGPAAQAGLKPGDVIIAVNGKSWTRLPLDQARETMKAAPGTKLALTLAGGSQRVLTLRDLI
jgi:PDZ domain